MNTKDRYYYIKKLIVTSLEDIPIKYFFSLRWSTDREYSPFYHSFFLVMAVDRPSMYPDLCRVQ